MGFSVSLLEQECNITALLVSVRNSGIFLQPLHGPVVSKHQSFFGFLITGMSSVLAGFSFCKYLSATDVLGYVDMICVISFREYLLGICVSFTSNCHSPQMNFFTVFSFKAVKDRMANLPLWDSNVDSSGDAVSHTPT